MGSYVPTTAAEREEMLAAIGVKDLEGLYQSVPQDMLLKDGVVYCLVKFDITLFIVVLSTYDSVELSLVIEDLRVTEVPSSVSRLFDKNLVEFFDFAVFIHPGTDLTWVTNPVFITNVPSIEDKEFITDLISRT